MRGRRFAEADGCLSGSCAWGMRLDEPRGWLQVLLHATESELSVVTFTCGSLTLLDAGRSAYCANNWRLR